MLRKLLKYDFRSMWKQFSVIWPAALVLALVNRFILFAPDNNIIDGAIRMDNGILAIISMSVFMGVLFAMFIVSMLYVLKRFYRGLLGDEGYLMHTLPVKTWQLVASKLVCAVLVTVVNVIVAGLAMFLMMPLKWSDVFNMRFWGDIFQGLAHHPGTILYLLEFCLMMGMALAFAVTQVYLAMAIGHLFSRRRALMSVVAYFGLNILLTMAINVVSKFEFIHHLTTFGSHAPFWIAIGLLAVPTTLFFAGTSYLLKNHLNLE